MCGVIAVGAVWFFCLRESEPSYNGRTLSEWLEQYDTARLSSHNAAYEQEAMTALAAIGSNALPYLVRWNSGYGSRFEEILSRFVKAMRSDAARKRLLSNNSFEKRHRLANAGFKFLGTNALAALPEVAAQFDKSNSSDINFVAYSLAQLGVAGIGKLSNAITSDALHREAARNALARVTRYPHDETVLNAATNALNAFDANPPKIDATPNW